MSNWGDLENGLFQVVFNQDEVYSIWPLDRELPLGWKAEGMRGTKQECLDHIEKVWIDMRPISWRKKVEEDAKRNL